MFRSCLLIFISLLVISCNDYQKLLNSPENEVDKYTAAEEYYENGEFRRSQWSLSETANLVQTISG